jgi:L-seryl-tRNA(Ser) seleniumtransferase
MDLLLADPRGACLREEFGAAAAHGALGEALEEARRRWRAGGALPGEEQLFAAARALLHERFSPPLRRVINATGVVLHTNLGRAPLPEKAVREAALLLSGYVDLELDLDSGERGHRDAPLERRVREYFDTESCLVLTNNNASATLLLLNTLSAAKETVVSRGELVEIGGGFRMPEVMAASGALLREVGTTNRTRISDYRVACGTNTGLLLKVHTSNYLIRGFAQDVSLSDLVALGRELQIPAGFDLGSGLTVPPGRLGLAEEPAVSDALGTGVNALCFSADKLFGACQAGLLLVAPELAARFRANPLLRAMRADKMAYAVLGAVLDLYRRGRWQEIPALAMLSAPSSALLSRARRLKTRIERAAPGRFRIQVIRAEGRVGGGCAPLDPLPSPALADSPVSGRGEALEAHLRAGGEPPVLPVMSEGRVVLHLRTLLKGEEGLLARRLAEFPEGEGP